MLVILVHHLCQVKRTSPRHNRWFGLQGAGTVEEPRRPVPADYRLRGSEFVGLHGADAAPYPTGLPSPVLLFNHSTDLEPDTRPVAQVALQPREHRAVVLTHPAQRLLILADLARTDDDPL